MSQERIVIEADDRNVLRTHLEDALGRDLPEDDASLDYILNAIAQHAADARTSVIMPPAKQDGTMAVRPFNGRYVLNTRRALVLSAAAALDALATRAIAVAALAFAGMDVRAIAALNEANGEFCAFVALEAIKVGDGPTIVELTEALRRMECVAPSTICQLHTASSLDLSDRVERVCAQLVDKGLARISTIGRISLARGA